jgi:hypothetical protein
VDLDPEADAALGVRLPTEWGGDLREAAAAIRARVGEGGRTAIVGDLDVALYMMSGSRPWIPTVPSAATIVTPRQFERAVADLDDEELAWNFVRTARPRPGLSRWFVPAFRAEIAKRFVPAGTVGGFEIWTRPRRARRDACPTPRADDVAPRRVRSWISPRGPAKMGPHQTLGGAVESRKDSCLDREGGPPRFHEGPYAA